MTLLKNVFFSGSVFCLSLIISGAACNKGGSSGGDPQPPPPPPPPPVTAVNDMDVWLTKGDQTNLLLKQNTTLSFGTTSNANSYIDVDTTQTFQTVDGFGYTLTGGSAYLINRMGTAEKAALLKELFGSESNSISISYLRISIGASDLNASVFTYDDVPAGETDVPLAKFSLAPDKADVIPLLKEILAINPAIKILATPWSAPSWMKDNLDSKGGSLKPEYYSVYASYFVKYIQAMKAEGITIDAITPQNEPLHPGNNPSMYMTSLQQADFIKNHLGPAFATAGIKAKIIVYDHNLDHPEYAIDILNDPAAKAFVDGSAFHLYAGNINTLSNVHFAHPDRNVYFTEQYTSATGDFGGDLKWHLKNVIIGSMRNWSKVALEWNLANDPSFNPHTPGGCTECKGAVTIAGSAIAKNVAYYIIAHVSKFVPPGSVRIGSSLVGSLQTVAFKTPAGKKVLVVENDGSDASFNIRFNNKWVPTSLPGGGVATYTW